MDQSESKNFNKIYIALGLVVLALAAILVFTRVNVKKVQEPAVSSPKANMQEAISFDELPTGGNFYVISRTSSTVKYSVSKEYFGKSAETVVGINTNINGSGSFDFETGKGVAKVTVDFADFKTSNEKRDKDILPLFASTAAELVVNLQGEQKIVEGEEFKLEVPASLTINSVTKPINLKVEGLITKESLTAKGSFNILMSDFGINAPSILNVYAVGDEVAISFEITADAR